MFPAGRMAVQFKIDLPLLIKTAGDLGLTKMKYNLSLDGIRAIAALIVVACHAGMPGIGGGFLGVDIFFVLSGYLITRLLHSEHSATGRIDFRSFCRRRLRRLFPALATLLVIYLIAAPLFFPNIPMHKHMLDATLSALYISDYARTLGVPPSVLNHTWSLSVEMQFYLLWPGVMLLLLRLPPRTAML